jgi:hypothetical protein
MNDIIPEDKLKTTTLGDLTQLQINATSAATFIPQREALDDLIRIWNAKRALSTSGTGGIIPSKGSNPSTSITDLPIAISASLKPGVGEVWVVDFGMLTVVNGASATCTVSMQLIDADGNLNYQKTGTVAADATGQPFEAMSWRLTESQYLQITSDRSEQSQVTWSVQFEAM